MAEQIIKKRCNTCKQTKPISEFYEDRRVKDGHFGKCKQCLAIYTKIYYRQKQRKRGLLVHGGRRPDRFSAKNAINSLIHRGKLSKANTNKCAYCHNAASLYHHFRGYEPEHHFDVVPVCNKCHSRLHKKTPANPV